MKRSLFLLLSILWSLNSQTQVSDETLKEYFLDAEFFFAQEEYADALVDYMNLYNNGFKDNANINYRIGICYLKIAGQKDKSIEYLLKAVKDTKTNNIEGRYKEVKAPMDAWLFLGIAYRVNYMLDQAVTTFQKYLEMVPKKDSFTREYVTKEIEACNKAKEFIQNPVQVKLVNLGDSINTASSNYRAVLSGDGKSLFYMNELPFYDAVYYSMFKNGAWQNPVNITAQIQSDGDQFISSVSFDGKRIYLIKDDGFNSDIWYSDLNDSLWAKSEPIKGNINSRFWESHASISEDGKTLYFASNQPKGFGAMDIYVSTLGEDNAWKTPVNLGSSINTPVNEDSPFITGDGKTLYFSSQGHNGMGGYDLYKSEMKADGSWSSPENLGYPLSTPDDDLFYYPWKNGEHSLISVFDLDGYGKEDIYEVQQLHGSMFKYLKEETPVSGTGPSVKNTVEDIKIVSIDLEKDTIVNETSAIKEIIEEKTVSEKENISEKVTEPVKKEIMLIPVYFDFNSFLINDNGKKQLDEVISVIKDLNTFQIILVGYTDALGAKEYNLTLSKKRAESALSYLLQKGIPAEKIKTKALGETGFAAINTNPDGTDNPEGRKLNRRVEFEFSGQDTENLILKPIEIPDHLKSR